MTAFENPLSLQKNVHSNVPVAPDEKDLPQTRVICISCPTAFTVCPVRAVGGLGRKGAAA